MNRIKGMCLVAVVACLAATAPAAEKDWAVEVFGNNHGGEARVLWLGDQGGAIGFYCGLSDDVLAGEDGVIRAGAVGRYNIITDGNAPVGNLLPHFLDWFKKTLGLPETTKVNTYAGVALGGMYGQEHGNLSYEVRPLLGMQVGFLAAEFGRGLGDIVGEDDGPSSWVWNLGLTFPF